MPWANGQTHCPAGHELTTDNTFVFPVSGYRKCRVCKETQDARRAAGKPPPKPRVKKGKKQRRRTVSMRGSLFRRLQVYCDSRGLSMAAYIEAKIEPDIADVEDPGERLVVPQQPARPRVEPEPASGYFTF